MIAAAYLIVLTESIANQGRSRTAKRKDEFACSLTEMFRVDRVAEVCDPEYTGPANHVLHSVADADNLQFARHRHSTKAETLISES